MRVFCWVYTMSYQGYDGYEVWAEEYNRLEDEHDAEASRAERKHNESMDLLISLEDRGYTLEQHDASLVIQQAWRDYMEAKAA